MPNLTPPKYRVLYQIYPGKACIHETAEMCQSCLEGRIRSIGRYVGKGPGGRGATSSGTPVETSAPAPPGIKTLPMARG